MNRYRIRQLVVSTCAMACAISLVQPVAAALRPDIADELKAGRLGEAQERLSKHLGEQPEDDLARFQLGTVQFFAAIERLAQDAYRFGLNPNDGMVPFLRMPVAANPQPEPVNYQDVRAMIQAFVNALEQAEATLAPIKDRQLSWHLDLSSVRLDMNGDGKAEADETLWSVFAQVALRRPQLAKPDSFLLGLDTADVDWLRGYCHLLAALGEMILAYDHQRQFDHTAHLFFANPQTPYASMLASPSKGDMQTPFQREPILDIIAFIHLASFPVHEPQRLAKARDHLLAMIEASRKSWERIEAETDDDREWIPGPGQTSVVEGVLIDKARLAAWRRFLDEAEAVLHGKKLIPFWRGSGAKGVSLMKAITEPQQFDLVLWVQGTGALPYLEDGDLSSPETWREFQRIFGGRFIGFAIWIN